MSHLIRTEIRKVFTTKLWWGLLLGALAITTLGVVATILSAGNAQSGIPPLSDPQTQRQAFGSTGAALIFILILGVIGVTTEYRHFTSRPTFLFEPRRGRVVAAKLVTYAGMGLLYSILCAALAVAIALPWLSARGVDVSLADNGIPRTLITTVASVAIFGMVGVGLGVLVRNQVAAVIGGLAYLFVFEPLVRVIPYVRDAYRFLPGGANEALTQSNAQGGPVELLDPWAGGMVLVGWGLLFVILGTVLTVRRDVP
ncbi:MAG TPA: ABC transporter permease [Mycobacteriales bacterium]